MNGGISRGSVLRMNGGSIRVGQKAMFHLTVMFVLDVLAVVPDAMAC